MKNARKLIPALTCALALGLSVSACGGNESEGGGETIEHKFGTTEAPTDPERVVSVGYSDQDFALALGNEPVGVREFVGGYEFMDRPWAAELETSDPEIVAEEEINYEAVAAQQPDLILALSSGIDQADYDRLSQIAPTVAQSGDYIDFGMPWQEQVVSVGKALGEEDEAEKIVADVEDQFAQVREDNPDFDGKSFTLAYSTAGEVGAYASGDTRVRFFEDLGFEPSEEIDELSGDAFFTALDKEQFRLLDQDVVVMYGKKEKVESDPVLSRLDAVREGRVVYIDIPDQFAGALGFGSPLSLPYLAEEAAPLLADAADGDPATVPAEAK